MRRRDFMAGIGLGLLASAPSWAKSSDARIEVLMDEPLGNISRNIYGHFTEHIGGVIYDGVWVGENSKIPNVYGIRRALIEGLQRISAPVIRWPGGCFADSYDWKDGVGPAAQRPTRTNFWEVDPDAKRLHEQGVQLFEDNAFGTNEFIRLCRLSGAQPYLAANLRSLPAIEFDHWVAYCNSPAGSTTLAKMREAAGFPRPFDVRYWGVGNESWGCGGNFRPEDYASEFRRFTDWVPAYGQDLYFIAAGPNDNDVDWTRRFFEQIFRGPHAYLNPRFRGWSIHHYARIPNGDALRFGPDEWYALLRSADQIEKIIADNWAIMGDYDQTRNIKLIVDEYGPWHKEGTEIDPTHIFGQQVTIRDAIVTALTLDCFNRNPEKVGMANCAQLVNNLNALFLAHEDRFLATPNFHVFAMYAAHQDAQAVRANFSASLIDASASTGGPTFWGLKGSASVKGKTLTVTGVNPSIDSALETQINIRGGKVNLAAGAFLAGQDIHAHNTFEDPNAVTSRHLDVAMKGKDLHVHIPPASIFELTLETG